MGDAALNYDDQNAYNHESVDKDQDDEDKPF